LMNPYDERTRRKGSPGGTRSAPAGDGLRETSRAQITSTLRRGGNGAGPRSVHHIELSDRGASVKRKTGLQLMGLASPPHRAKPGEPPPHKKEESPRRICPVSVLRMVHAAPMRRVPLHIWMARPHRKRGTSFRVLMSARPLSVIRRKGRPVKGMVWRARNGRGRIDPISSIRASSSFVFLLISSRL